MVTLALANIMPIAWFAVYHLGLQRLKPMQAEKAAVSYQPVSSTGNDLGRLQSGETYELLLLCCWKTSQGCVDMSRLTLSKQAAMVVTMHMCMLEGCCCCLLDCSL